MVGLLSLPDELLGIIILEHLIPSLSWHDTPDPVDWVGNFSQTSKHTFRQCNTLSKVILTCKRLHGLLQRVLYQVPNLVHRPNQLHDFKRTIQAQPEHGAQTDAVISLCPSAYEVIDLFWLAHVKHIALKRFNDWDAVEWHDDSHRHTSNVSSLYLIDCGAHEGPLKEMISWPQALTELRYEADQGEWSGRREGEEEIEWTCSGLIRALEPQRETLQHLIITRTDQVHEGLGYSDSLDLSEFSMLKSLFTVHVFLNGFSSRLTESLTYSRFPPSLEELQVLYDDTGYIDFLENDPEWLRSVLSHSKESLPNLKKIHIWSHEAPYVEEGDSVEYLPSGMTARQEEFVKSFEVPAEFRSLAREANIELEINLGYRMTRHERDLE